MNALHLFSGIVNLFQKTLAAIMAEPVLSFFLYFLLFSAVYALFWYLYKTVKGGLR